MLSTKPVLRVKKRGMLCVFLFNECRMKNAVTLKFTCDRNVTILHMLVTLEQKSPDNIRDIRAVANEKKEISAVRFAFGRSENRAISRALKPQTHTHTHTFVHM